MKKKEKQKCFIQYQQREGETNGKGKFGKLNCRLQGKEQLDYKRNGKEMRYILVDFMEY